MDMQSSQSQASICSSTPSTQSAANVEANAPLSGQQPTPAIMNQLPPTSKKRKDPVNRSPMWSHFTKCKVAATGGIDSLWCTCNYCYEKVLCDKHKNGTSSMWNHARKCKLHPLFERDPKQSKLTASNVSGGAGYHKYNKKRCDDKCIEMIIKDELPFRFVKKEGFLVLCKELEPNWKPIDRKQIAKGVLDKYNYEKAALMSQFKESQRRVSITTDTWTSIQNINYMVVTAHFLDDDWKLHKRIISFCSITSHKGDDIGRMIEQCLRQWEISKVFTITVDNASANDVAVGYMKRRLKIYKTLMFGGDFVHNRCSCHIINLIVKDGLKELEEGIAAIWNCAKYVRSSSQRLDKFREFAVLEQCKANANVLLDVVTRWNSTYLMLESALIYEQTFNRMAEEDSAFKSYFEEKDKYGKKRVGPPSYDDWRNAEAFCVFLKRFYDATLRLSAWKTITANILFVEMITLQTETDKAILFGDPVLKKVAASMKTKFNKYWGSFESINKIIMIANVLDPRYKLQWAKVGFKKVNASQEVIEAIEASEGCPCCSTSKLAKDVLAVPCSTVAFENAFSLGSRVVDPFRASLTPTTVEALVCCSDWLRAEPTNFSFYDDPTEDDLEVYKELEEIEKANAFNQSRNPISSSSVQTDG